MPMYTSHMFRQFCQQQKISSVDRRAISIGYDLDNLNNIMQTSKKWPMFFQSKIATQDVSTEFLTFSWLKSKVSKIGRHEDESPISAEGQ